MIGQPCKYDMTHLCTTDDKCIHKTILACLKFNCACLFAEIYKLKQTRMQKHNKASVRWRSQSFYYKRKVRLLSEYIENKGYKVPKAEELEVAHGICRDDKNRPQGEGPSIQTV